MAVDQSLVGREFPPTRPYTVSEEKVREFAFLDAESIDLFRIVHGDQKFTYERAVVPGDVLSATLTVASLRQIGGNDIIGTTSRITDADGALVCATSATLVHRGGEA